MLEIILEVLVVVVVVGLQIRTFLQTRAKTRQLSQLYPPRETLRVEQRLLLPDGRDLPEYAADAPADAYPATLLKADNASTEFEEILLDTNDYLRHNKGAAADFGILKDISERRSQVLDNEVQANVSTPLYLGLLGTFLGVILGLVGIARNGVSDENALTPFLTGVLIAMTGSFVGLLLTLLGNGLLREARRQLDGRQNQYYTVLQVRLLPILHSDMAGSLSNLKSVLDAFNQQFVGQVDLFNPLMDKVTENIRVQSDFLQRLDTIGYDKMAAANIAVFEKVRESADMFAAFTGYQQQLNQMLENGYQSAQSVNGILDRLRGFEKGINDLGQYVGSGNNSVQLMLDFFQKHQTELRNLRDRAEQHIDQAGVNLADILTQRQAQNERQAQLAYEKWQQYYQQLNADNVFEKLLKQLEPFQNLNVQQADLSRDVTATQRELLRKVELDSQIQAKLLAEISNLNTVLVKATAKNSFQRFMDKLFGGVKPV
ncbi:hypothetical protein [Hymenobacter rubripertinctus]|uniref:MotA/TolQ/ExbB proton channel domain-containing protein n=1 Tax=Hymenobacter rubripertinctus TaxID=2029981 RepID=A0A418R5Y2_9BACT|nr:hypothetical protein [Hymenobacter rubripertinctus]RIY12877.1 hypothetical protein D0T11_03895 [Hymenobacter rubripertinctus]